MYIVQLNALQHFITTTVFFVWLLCYLWYYIPPCIFVTILPFKYILRKLYIYDYNISFFFYTNYRYI